MVKPLQSLGTKYTISGLSSLFRVWSLFGKGVTWEDGNRAMSTHEEDIDPKSSGRSPRLEAFVNTRENS